LGFRQQKKTASEKKYPLMKIFAAQPDLPFVPAKMHDSHPPSPVGTRRAIVLPGLYFVRVS
jgi:hypothetical protein